jgi:tRNA(Ile)-lysidine synthase
MVEEIAARHITQDGAGRWVLTRHDVPREIQRRLIQRLIASADPDAPAPRGETIDQALVQLLCGKRVSVGSWLIDGGKQWTLRAAPQRNSR